MTAAPHDYRPHIDGLRAVAVSCVFAYHLDPTVLPGGYVGVDVFFVISGFLITRIILREMDEGRFSLARFYERRARRLLPALAAVLLVTTAAAWILLMPDELRLYGRSLISTALFISNVHFLGQAGYFDGAAQSKPLLHTWSLAVEEQFYLAWPLLLMAALALLRRSGRAAELRRTVLWLVLAASVASLAAAEAVARVSASTAFFLTPFRAWELGVGAGLACIDRSALERVPDRLRGVLGLAGATAIVAGVVLLTSQSLVPGWPALAPVLGAAAVIAFGDRGIVGWVLSARPMVALGLVSYPVYLWHWPALAFLHGQSGRGPTAWEAAAAVGAVLVLAVLTTRFVERPIRHGSWTPTWRPLAVTAAVLLLAVGVGRALQLQGGWTSRLDPEARAIYDAYLARNPYRRACDGPENALVGDETCNFGSPKGRDAPFDMAVIGDSQADQWVPAMAEVARARGWSGRQITTATCAPVLGSRRLGLAEQYNERCVAFQEALVSFLDRNSRLREVVLAGNWPAFADGAIDDAGRFVDPQAAEFAGRFGPRGTFAWHMAATIAMVRRTGAEVVLMAPIPHLSGYSVRCVVDAAAAGRRPVECGTARARIEQATAAPTAVLERLAAEIGGVRVVRPMDVLCDAHHCLPTVDGVLAYSDFGHLNARGAVLLGRRLGLVPGGGDIRASRAGG